MGEADWALFRQCTGREVESTLETYVPREVVEAAVAPGRYELAPISTVRYFAFVDPSGGTSDSMTVAIAHREKDGRAVLDAIRERRPPFSPEDVTSEFAMLLKAFASARSSAIVMAASGRASAFGFTASRTNSPRSPRATSIATYWLR